MGIPQRRLENFLLSLLITVAGFIANYLRDITQSIEMLNKQMMVVLERVTLVGETLRDHEDRIRRLEK